MKISPKLKVILRLVGLIGILILSAFWYAQERYSNEALLDRYALNVEPEWIKSKCSSKEVLDACNAFASGNYQQVIDLTLDVLPDNPDFIFSEYLSGQAYLKTERPSNAILAFESVNGFGKSEMQDKAKWMLAISYLRRGRMEEGRALIQEYAQDDSFEYQQLAIQILDDLESVWRKLPLLK
ncbi:MAG: hypothetical protein R2879_02180 [Saprospiraceae bacterium]